MGVERSLRVVEGFTETTPTSVGQYLIACSETYYEIARVSIMKVLDELYVKDPVLGNMPLKHYDLIDLLWKRVPNACDMRGVIIEEGDTVIGIDVCCLNYSIGVVVEIDSARGQIHLDNYDVPFDQADCLVLPSHYKEKVVDSTKQE